MNPLLDYDSLWVSVLYIMGLEHPFICVIPQDRLNNDKWSAELEFTCRLVTSFCSANSPCRPYRETPRIVWKLWAAQQENNFPYISASIVQLPLLLQSKLVASAPEVCVF